MTFECSTCGHNRKNSAGEGGSHENGCDGLARGRTSPHADARPQPDHLSLVVGQRTDKLQ